MERSIFMNLRMYILRHKTIFAVVTIMSVLGVLGQTISATFWTPMIDALASKKSSTFWWWIVIDLASALFRFGFGQLADYLQEKAKQSVNVDIQHDLITGIANMNLPGFRNRTVGQYTSWLTNDIQQIDEKGLTTFFSIIMYSAGVVFPLISLALYHWSLCVVAIVCGVIMTIAPRALQKVIEDGSSELTHTNESFVNSADNVLNANCKNKLATPWHDTVR